MSEKTVLVITSKLDPHADVVIGELERLSQRVYRLNTDDFLNEYTIDLEVTGSSACPSIRARDTLGRILVIPTGVKSVYYRKPKPIGRPKSLSNEVAWFAIEEATEVLKSIYAFTDMRWINHPSLIRSAQSKFPQLRLAKHLGLNVPRTLITNNPERARLFFRECQGNIICKSLIATAIKYEDTYYHTYTHRLTVEEFESNVESVKYAPTLFQEYVPKQTELRITVIGRRIFPCEIDSQTNSDACVDWRVVDPFTIPHRPCEIPVKLADAILKFMQLSNLAFSAFDFIHTPSGEYYFLENNPNGQWYWIEMMTKQPMAREMAKLLAAH